MTKVELHRLVDELPENAVASAAVILGAIQRSDLDPDQAWFWTPEWLAGELEVEAQKAQGKGRVFNSTEEFLAHLDEVASSED